MMHPRPAAAVAGLVATDGAGHATLYKNGTAIATGTGTVPANVNRTVNYLGKSPHTNTSDALYQGLMSNVSVWNTTLTAAQVQGIMNQRLTGSETGLVA